MATKTVTLSSNPLRHPKMPSMILGPVASRGGQACYAPVAFLLKDGTLYTSLKTGKIDEWSDTECSSFRFLKYTYTDDFTREGDQWYMNGEPLYDEEEYPVIPHREGQTIAEVTAFIDTPLTADEDAPTTSAIEAISTPTGSDEGEQEVAQASLDTTDSMNTGEHYFKNLVRLPDGAWFGLSETSGRLMWVSDEQLKSFSINRAANDVVSYVKDGGKWIQRGKGPIGKPFPWVTALIVLMVVAAAAFGYWWFVMK